MKTILKFSVFTGIILLCFGGNAFSQVSINIDGTSPNTNAMLDVKSTSLGVLFPRMTISQRNSISLPTYGLMVFCTDNNQYYYADGGLTLNSWSPLSLWNRTSGVANASIYYTGNVGFGSTAPPALLTVGSSNQFQINSTGNINRINNVPTSFPSTQGAANSVLQNDGSGNLAWATGGIKQVVRGTVTTAAVTFSSTFSPPSTVVNPAKCVVETRWTNTDSPTTKTHDLVVTNLTSTTIYFQKSDNADNRMVEYQIIEYY